MTLEQEMLIRETRVREEAYAKGKAEGKAEGRAEGKAEGRISLLRAMKANGMSSKEISKATGISPIEIENLIAQ